jgi:hypothetical protein
MHCAFERPVHVERKHHGRIRHDQERCAGAGWLGVRFALGCGPQGRDRGYESSGHGGRTGVVIVRLRGSTVEPLKPKKETGGERHRGQDGGRAADRSGLTRTKCCERDEEHEQRGNRCEDTNEERPPDPVRTRFKAE